MLNLKKLGLLAALGSLVAIQACDIDVTYGVGGWERDRDHRHGGGDYRRGDHYRGDGYWRDGVWYDGHYHRLPRGVRLSLANREEPTAAEYLAADYDISISAARTLLNITNGDDASEGLKVMGLRTRDLRPLRKMELPKQDVINQIAASVGESRSKIQGVMEGYIAQARAEKVAR